MTDAVRRLHDDLSDDLDRIKRRFNSTPRLSLIVRFPGEPGKGLYLTDDTREEMNGQIDYLEQHVRTAPEDLIEAKTGPLAQPAAREGLDPEFARTVTESTNIPLKP